jgi:hypothetical protein
MKLSFPHLKKKLFLKEGLNYRCLPIQAIFKRKQFKKNHQILASIFPSSLENISKGSFNTDILQFKQILNLAISKISKKLLTSLDVFQLKQILKLTIFKIFYKFYFLAKMGV